MSTPMKDNRIKLVLVSPEDNCVKLVLVPHLTRKPTGRCLQLVDMQRPYLCGENATGQHCPVCGTPTCSKHLSRKTITLNGHVINNMCLMCAELPEGRARDLWNLRLHLESLYEKAPLWPFWTGEKG